jgi:hypothetical protein
VKAAIATIAVVALTTVSACSDTPLAPPPPPTPRTIAVGFCTDLPPTWVAFQDGDGAWTPVQPTVSGSITTFRHEFSADRGGIAAVSRFGELTVSSVFYGTPGELVAAGDTNPRHCSSSADKTLLGTAVGIDSADVAFVGTSIGARARVSVDHTFELRGLPEGPRELLATRFVQATGAPTRFILRRDVDLPDNTQLPVFDFASAEAFSPAVATLTINGLGAEGATSGTRLLTRHDELSVTPATDLTAEATRPYFALPEAVLQAGDLQIVTATTNLATTGSARTATLYFRAPIDRVLPLGALLIPPAFTTIATAPGLRLSARFVPQGDYDRAASVVYQQDHTTFVAVTMTESYSVLSGKGYELSIPDLSGAAGFDPAWALRAGAGHVLFWNATRIGGTLELGNDVVPTEGKTRRTVAGTGVF